MIYNSIVETIGNTPMVKLNKIFKDLPGTVVAKVEYFNPGNSTKDRMALKMIEDAEKAGILKPGGTIIEGTSGNTGMGLALTAVAKGYKCIFTMADKQSQEKINILKAVGAEVIVCPTNVEPDDPRSYYSVARKLNKEIPNSIYPNQYDNPSNAVAHYEATGPEIWKQSAGKITRYVACVGTGGSMCGTSRYLKEQNKNIVSVGIDTYGSVFKKYKETGIFDRNEIYPYLTEGFGEDILPKNVDFDAIDTFIKVTDKDGAIMARRLSREEGLFVGWSSGSAVHGALEYAKEHLKKDDVMVILLPDHGTRYLAKVYNDQWMKDHGFLEERTFATARDIISRRNGQDKLYTIPASAKIADAIVLLNKEGIMSVAYQRPHCWRKSSNIPKPKMNW
jgi:cystathionine beta-synthase